MKKIILIIMFVLIAGDLLALPESEIEYDQEYNLPYFQAGEGLWSGVAISNPSAYQGVDLKIMLFDQLGNLAQEDLLSLEPSDHTAFVVNPPENIANGSMAIFSTIPIYGLSFFGTTDPADNYMADINMKNKRYLEEDLAIPHVAQNAEWDTTVYLTNPSEANEIHLQVLDRNGQMVYEYNSTMSNYESIVLPLNDKIKSLDTGKIVVKSSRKINAFALYSNIKSGGRCYSGLASTP